MENADLTPNAWQSITATYQELILHGETLTMQQHAYVISGLNCTTCKPGEGQGETAPCILKRDWTDGCIALILMNEDPGTRMGYLTLLHELGHLATGLTKDRKRFARAPILRQEAEAWRWAFNQSIIRYTPEEYARIANCMRGYSCPRHKKAPKHKPDPVFDLVFTRITAAASAETHDPPIL